jgi:hypothetical protein
VEPIPARRLTETVEVDGRRICLSHNSLSYNRTSEVHDSGRRLSRVLRLGHLERAEKLPLLGEHRPGLRLRLDHARSDHQLRRRGNQFGQLLLVT